MATLILQTAGQIIGSTIAGPTGAAIGRAIGAAAGYYADQTLFGNTNTDINQQGARLGELHIQTSSEGTPITKIYGKARIAGQIIWATHFEEEIITNQHTTRRGGKGGARSRATTVTTTQYVYYANFAIGLCEGPITGIGRVWADGKEIDINLYQFRLYKGDENQQPDHLIEAKEGTNNAPAYRGIAYIVFEKLPLEKFGNRIPQITCEILRALDDVEKKITAMSVIPGATEFGYDTKTIIRTIEKGNEIPENNNISENKTDWTLSIDQLQQTCPNVKHVSLIVGWFANDLRAGKTKIKPGVDNKQKNTRPESWHVAGVNRNNAYLVTTINDRAAFGGTPADASVIRAVKDLKKRGIKIMLHPFIFLDIPENNTLPDINNPNQNQPAFPWRGHITAEKNIPVATQINALFGNAQPTQFSAGDNTVTYNGTAEWSIRRMILHYAHLMKIAGGIDAFLIGSEMKGITTLFVKNNQTLTYPAVTHYKNLARDVAQILPNTEISYGADWGEYFGHLNPENNGDIQFHLDPLWASPHIHFIGINNYMPLADWRDQEIHKDKTNTTRSIYDLNYLKNNIAAGEGFNWFYQSDQDRQNQTRTTINDAQYQKHWVFRYKDLIGWWSNRHYNRQNGQESRNHTQWVPKSKEIRFTEAGCPAVDKGANQPNKFPDPKSSDSGLPHFSSGYQDDLMQRKYIQAMLEYWKENAATNKNPTHNNITMVNPEHIYLWAWDARPFPTFPYLKKVWSDSENYPTGHWINGRMGGADLASLVSAIMRDFNIQNANTAKLSGITDGYLITQPMSPRQAIQPLLDLFFFDAAEIQGNIQFSHRNKIPVRNIKQDEFVEENPQKPLYTLVRNEKDQLPEAIRVNYIDAIAQYRNATTEKRKPNANHNNLITRNIPIVATHEIISRQSERLLQEIWAAREILECALPPNMIELDPGDIIQITLKNKQRQFRITEIRDTQYRMITAIEHNPKLYNPIAAPQREFNILKKVITTKPVMHIIDIPIISDNHPQHGAYIAATAKIWRGSAVLLRAFGNNVFQYTQTIQQPAIIGETLWDFYRGPTAVFDKGNVVRVRLYFGEIDTIDQNELFAGKNAAAIKNTNGQWEIIQFKNAKLVDKQTYDISYFLRGQLGTENAMQNPVPKGAPFVILNDAVSPINIPNEEIGLENQWKLIPQAIKTEIDNEVTITHTVTGRGRKPLSPVHVRAYKKPNGDVTISWIRRSRINADNWNQNEIPLGEEQEQYHIDIIKNQKTVRTITANQTQTLYTKAQINQDWGKNTNITQLKIRLFQISQTFGRGTPRETQIYV